jgi:hypothetical protein
MQSTIVKVRPPFSSGGGNLPVMISGSDVVKIIVVQDRIASYGDNMRSRGLDFPVC